MASLGIPPPHIKFMSNHQILWISIHFQLHWMFMNFSSEHWQPISSFLLFVYNPSLNPSWWIINAHYYSILISQYYPILSILWHNPNFYLFVSYQIHFIIIFGRIIQNIATSFLLQSKSSQVLSDQSNNVLISLRHGFCLWWLVIQFAIWCLASPILLRSRCRFTTCSIVLWTAIRLHILNNSLFFTRWGRKSTVFRVWRGCQYCLLIYLLLLKPYRLYRIPNICKIIRAPCPFLFLRLFCFVTSHIEDDGKGNIEL